MLTRTEKEWAFRTETILRRFEEPDDVRTFQKGKFEIVRIGGITVAMDDGTIHELRAAMLFYIPLGPPGHDIGWWVMHHMSRYILSAQSITQTSS